MASISRSTSVSSKTLDTCFVPLKDEKTKMDRLLETLSDIQEDREKFYSAVNGAYESTKLAVKSPFAPSSQLETVNCELSDKVDGVHLKVFDHNFLSPEFGLSRNNSLWSQATIPMSPHSTSLPINHDLTEESLKSKVDLLDTLVSSKFKGYHHATWYCSNAKQTANYFIHCFGFKWVAYKGLETGSRLVASHVVKNGDVIFEFISPIVSPCSHELTKDEILFITSIHRFIEKHGDGVKDVSFEVDDVDLVFEHATKAGAKPITRPTILKDEFGEVKVATIEVFDEVNHTLIEKKDYSRGFFIPGYAKVEGNDLYELKAAHSIVTLPPINLTRIDHCVQNEDWDRLKGTCEVYSKIFGFHKFWSVDEKDVSTEYSALRSIVMSSANELIKMPINEPAKGKCKSQIEEFLTFYNGPGIQHIAVLTDDIIQTVGNMKSRGAQFIKVPPMYYSKLLPRLLDSGVKIHEDLRELEKLNILVDFDANGYLLQIFTKPLGDRPTFFLEVIQRHNHNGFGKGNFKTLFESIEAEQRLRGTL